jgi:hypothetical protein
MIYKLQPTRKENKVFVVVIYVMDYYKQSLPFQT